MNTRNKPQQSSISLVVRCFLGLTDLLVTLNFFISTNLEKNRAQNSYHIHIIKEVRVNIIFLTC